MKPDVMALVNSGVRDLTPYEPGKSLESLKRELGIDVAIKLASNENPLGASPKAIQAATEALSRVHMYPENSYFQLKELLATRLDIMPNQITMGNGSDNILELIAHCFLQQGDSAVLSQYAFLAMVVLVRGIGANINWAQAVNWGHDVDHLLSAVDAKTRLLFLANPNNPTGTYITEAQFTRLMDTLSPEILVVLDQAYAEYIDKADYPCGMALLKRYPNLIVTRTFSKAYGLAALRIGYSVSSPEVADLLNRVRLPFNVSTVAAKAAYAALLDHEHLKKTVELNNAGRSQLELGFKQLQLDYIPSIANFITVKIPQADVVYQKLLRHGVIVRPISVYGMPDYLRVTVGTQQQNQCFLAALEKVLTGLDSVTE